jgi:urease accessory protein
MLRKVLPVSLLTLCLTTTASLAHIGHGHAGFAQGFAHPLGGLDHDIVMVAVGLFAWNLGGRGVWLVPSAFIATMIGGGVLGYDGYPLPLVEGSIGLSVVVTSLAIAAGVRLSTAAAMALVGVFALFHGYAHGAEGIGLGAFLPYAAGFVSATALLHAAGIGIGLALDRLRPQAALAFTRAAGALGVLAGIGILAGVV